MKALAAALLAGAPLAALAGPSAVLYTPPLPALSSQYFECVIVNISASPQTVTTQAFDSNGGGTAGPYIQTLAAGQSGGFSAPGWSASMYCKFTVTGVATNYRAAVNVIGVNPDGSSQGIVVTLPAQ